MLHKVLHDSKLYRESLEVADIVASEHHCLYLCFDRQTELPALLALLAQSEVALLDSGSAPTMPSTLFDVAGQVEIQCQ